MNSEPKSTKLPLLIAILVITESLVGILSIYLLERTDTLYSRIIELEVQTLRHLNALTLESHNIQQYCLSLLLVENPSEIQSFQERISRAWGKKDEHLEKLAQLTKDSESERLLAELKKSREAYFQACESCTKLVSTFRARDAVAPRAAILHPAFEAYQAAQTALGDYIHILAAKANDANSAQTELMRNILIGFTTWPFVLGIAMALIFMADIGWRVWKIRQNSV